jgi:hypothetical protein
VVDPVRAYSNRLDLRDELGIERFQRGGSAESSDDGSPSVRSSGRSERQWRVNDRLGEEALGDLVEQFRAGTSKRELAER